MVLCSRVLCAKCCPLPLFCAFVLNFTIIQRYWSNTESVTKLNDQCNLWVIAYKYSSTHFSFLILKKLLLFCNLTYNFFYCQHLMLCSTFFLSVLFHISWLYKHSLSFRFTEFNILFLLHTHFLSFCFTVFNILCFCFCSSTYTLYTLFVLLFYSIQPSLFLLYSPLQKSCCLGTN